MKMFTIQGDDIIQVVLNGENEDEYNIIELLREKHLSEGATIVVSFGKIGGSRDKKDNFDSLILAVKAR